MPKTVWKLAGVLLLYLLFPAPPAGAEDPPDVDALLRKLSCVSIVESGLASPMSEFGDFQRIYQALAKTKVADLPEKLLKSERPVERVMGLALLVDRDGEKAVPALTARLSDRAPVDLRCADMGVAATVGSIAFDLLRDSAFFGESWHERRPLLDDEAQFRLEMELLARDDTAMMHRSAGEEVDFLLSDEESPLDLDALAKRLPDLPPERVVRALGRCEFLCLGTDVVRAWLRTLTGDPARSAAVRLAAASALTRWNDRGSPDEARKALLSAKEVLVAHGAGGILDRFDENRDYHERREASPAFVAGCPAALDRIEWDVPAADDDDPELPERTAAALVALVGRLPEWSEPWNTWGDVAYRVDDLLRRQRPTLGRCLGEEKLATLEQKVAAATAGTGR